MNLRYLLVDVDGVASFGAQPWEAIRALVGPEGPARVGLNPQLHAAGWVNDVGLLDPQTYPRNVTGSVLLGSLGAAQQPYAGPVVITGWDAHATWRGESEVRGLHDAHVPGLTTLCTDIRRVLDGGEPGGSPLWKAQPLWAQSVLAFAQHVRTAPTPTATVVTDPEQVLALLRRMGGAR